MRPNKKESWLFATPLLVFSVVGSAAFWRYINPTEVVVSIGLFDRQILQERAAFKRLSIELRKHPQCNIYKIRSSDPGAPERDVLVYTRRKHKTRQKGLISIDHQYCDHLSRGIRGTENIIDADIHSIAKKNGDFMDLPLRFSNGVVKKMR